MTHRVSTFNAVLLKAVRTPPGAVPTPPVIQLLKVQKGINRTQLHAHYLLSSFILSCTRRIRKSEKNNVTSLYAETYTTINCKT